METVPTPALIQMEVILILTKMKITMEIIPIMETMAITEIMEITEIMAITEMTIRRTPINPITRHIQTAHGMAINR